MTVYAKCWLAGLISALFGLVALLLADNPPTWVWLLVLVGLFGNLAPLVLIRCFGTEDSAPRKGTVT